MTSGCAWRMSRPTRLTRTQSIPRLSACADGQQRAGQLIGHSSRAFSREIFGAPLEARARPRS